MLLLVTVSVVYSGCFRFIGCFGVVFAVLIGWYLAVWLGVFAVCFFGVYGCCRVCGLLLFVDLLSLVFGVF